VKASSSWYVATTGSDAAIGDIGHPFKTIQKGVDVSVAGDTIYVRGGNYNEKISIVASGTAGNPITIKNYGDEHVVINGAGISLEGGYGLIQLWSGSGATGRKYITIEGLVIENSSRLGIGTLFYSTSPSNNITVKKCTFHNIQYNALNFWGAGGTHKIYDIHVSNCTFDGIELIESAQECVTFSGCRRVVFRDNYMTNIHQTGVNCANDSQDVLIYNNKINTSNIPTGDNGIYVDGRSTFGTPCTRINISNNLIWGTGTGIVIACEISGGRADNVSIWNNIVNVSYPARGNCISFSSEVYSNLWDITIKYNTLYNAGSATHTYNPLHIISTAAQTHRVTIANNIFSGRTTYQLYTYLDSTDNDLIRYNNLYYRFDGTTNTYYADGTGFFEFSKVKADPQFVSLASYDFHLNATSPAVDAATALYVVDTDCDGITRPKGANYDIGAYEYEQGSGDSTPPVISQVGVATSSPLDTLTGYGWENFTCTVTDNIGVSTVLLKLTNPDQSTANVPMIKKTGTTAYYANQSLHQQGNYSYRIQATDTNNNVALSSSHIFSLPPNWDINNDGVVTILDLVLVSNHYSDIGGYGWIREDVDNNAIIQVFDIVIVSNHFGESWYMV
jgi:hypothetical protein